jgi:hypothetical protein
MSLQTSACIDDTTTVHKWLYAKDTSALFMFGALTDVRCIMIDDAGEDVGTAIAILEVCKALCKQLGIEHIDTSIMTREEYKRWAISAMREAELGENAMRVWLQTRELIKRVMSPVKGLLGLYCFVYQAKNAPK